MKKAARSRLNKKMNLKYIDRTIFDGSSFTQARSVVRTKTRKQSLLGQFDTVSKKAEKELERRGSILIVQKMEDSQPERVADI